MTIQSVYSQSVAIAFTVNNPAAGTGQASSTSPSSSSSDYSGDDTATISSAAQALSTASQDPSSRVDDIFKKLDTNGDGSISKDEFKDNASKVADDLRGVHRGHHGRHGRRLEKLFSRIDSNGDGTIDKDELAAALKKGGPQRQSLDADALFKKLDANGDGSISKDELTAALSSKSSSASQPASSTDSTSSTNGTSTTGTSTTGSTTGASPESTAPGTSTSTPAPNDPSAPSSTTSFTFQAIYFVSFTAIVQYQAAAKAPASSQVGTQVSAAA